MPKKVLILLLLLLTITGCTHKVFNPNYSFTEKNKGKGLVVLSISQTGQMQRLIVKKIPYKQHYTYRQKNVAKVTFLVDPKTVNLNILTNANSKNSQIRGVAGEVQLFELEPGNYEFDSYTIEGSLFSRSWHHFNYSFAVKAGEINYIGNLNSDIQLRDKNSSFSPTLKNLNPNITIADKFDRDIAVFKKKFPKLANTEVLNVFNASNFKVKAR